ncbi:chorismate-binding protein [Specibacter cremeus]|uniref:chorismate-binding protein n=1 Tax=Specibacter cremeus TaxID=1629051 RepID=UPI000F7A4804|nr:chorismate-binding protein [Specibacter cremeus]
MADAGRPVIIAVDGRSGAGKTTLALELAALLRRHRSVTLFHLEDIYPGWNGLAAGVDRYVAAVLTPLAEGRDAHWSGWDWAHHYDGASRTSAVADVVLVEGVGAAHASALPFLDAVIWVDAPDEARKHRALDRDGETYAPFWDMWAAQEDALFAGADMRARADIVVDASVGDASGDAASGTPERVLDGLGELPALEQLLAPERARHRGLEFTVERLGWPAGLAVEDLFDALCGARANAVWLDSSSAEPSPGGPAVLPTANVPAGQSRFSILADDAGHFGRTAEHRDGATTVTARTDAGTVSTRIPGPFFRRLDASWGRRAVKAPDGYPCEFTLGWLGYLGYELKRETGGTAPGRAADTPDALLLFAGRAVVVDHQGRSLFLLTLAEPGNRATLDEAERWREGVRRVVGAPGHPARPTPSFPPLHFAIRDPEPAYKAKIAAAQRQIRDGNTYEVCLTTALTTETPARLDGWDCYRALRRRSPAPFAAYLRFGALEVCSSSPERFLRLDAAGLMRAEPIKGTRRRDPDPVVDAALRADLGASAKDRAENVMIVDLLRNDLSHFAQPSTLAVPRLCALESYATVHQLVSTVEARLAPGVSRAEAVAAAFPAGSMTGAPKISTMAILDALEDAPRGVYSGAIGYFSLNAAADLSVPIRTLVLVPTDDGGTRLGLGVGGAITADSSADDEWREIQAKAFGVLSTLGAEFPD